MVARDLALRAQLAREAVQARYRGMTAEQRTEVTARARAAWLEKLADEVDPYRELPEPLRIEEAKKRRRERMAALTRARLSKRGGGLRDGA